MSQSSLDFGLLYRCDEEFRASMRAINDAYDAAGSIVCAGVTGVGAPDLSKMFEPGSGRHMRFSAVLKIGAIASYELRRRALIPIARCWGLGVTERTPMTADEKALRYEAKLRAIGGGMGVGDQLVNDALEGR